MIFVIAVHEALDRVTDRAPCQKFDFHCHPIGERSLADQRFCGTASAQEATKSSSDRIADAKG
jgi:hypothetical protein